MLKLHDIWRFFSLKWIQFRKYRFVFVLYADIVVKKHQERRNLFAHIAHPVVTVTKGRKKRKKANYFSKKY